MSKQNKSNAQLAVVGAVKTAKVTKIPPKPDFYQKVTRINDPDLLSKITEEQAEAEFDASHDELHLVTIRQPQFDQELEASATRLEELEEKVKTTPKKIKSCAQHTNAQQQDVRFGDWSMPDKLSAALISGAAITCLIMSAANVFANLKSSGDPIYVDNNLICFFIACLAPACSIAIKFLGNLFEDNDRAKKLFTHSVFFASTLSFFIWVYLFSMSYNVSGDIDWDSFGESNGFSEYLSFFQLLTEILVGGALALALSDIFLKYSPNRKIENPDYLDAVKERDAHKAEHLKLRDERNENHKRKEVLLAERKTFVNDKLIDVVDRKSRQNALNDL